MIGEVECAVLENIHPKESQWIYQWGGVSQKPKMKVL